MYRDKNSKKKDMGSLRFDIELPEGTKFSDLLKMMADLENKGLKESKDYQKLWNLYHFNLFRTTDEERAKAAALLEGGLKDNFKGKLVDNMIMLLQKVD